MRCLIIITVLFLTVNSLYAITLDEAVKVALENNYQINSVRHLATASKHILSATKALKMPSFFLNSEYTYLNDSNNIKFSTPFGSENLKMTEQDYINLSTGIKLNLYTGGFISGSISKALHNYYASKYKLQETELDVKYNTQIAYINILELLSYKKIAEKHLEALEKHYKNVECFYNEGMVPYIDMLQTEVKVKDAVQKLTSINNSVKVAKTNLVIILGKEATDNISIVNIQKNYIKKLKTDILFNIAKENRPVLKMLDCKIKAAESEIQIASSGYKPKIFVAGGYNYSDMQPSVEHKDNFLFQTGLTFQLDWDKSFNEVKAAKENKYALIINKKDIESKILLGVKKVFEDYNTAVSNLQVANSTVKSAKEYYRTIKLKYKEGLTDNSHVLDAEAMLTKALMTEKTFYFNIIKKFFLMERVIGKEF